MKPTKPLGSTSLARQFSNELGLLAAIVVVVGVTTIFSDAYRVKPLPNAEEILRQTALLGVFALGAAIVIISGGIDLSSGSVIAFSGSVCAAIMLALAPVDERGNPVTDELGLHVYAIAIAGTLVAGFLIGTLHAWLITVIELPPFVATLASLVGLRSLAKVFVQKVAESLTPTASQTNQLYINDPAFSRLGTSWWIPLATFAALCLVAWVMMSRMVVGRHLYAMGGNEAAARLSGIRTDRLKWLAYCAERHHGLDRGDSLHGRSDHGQPAGAGPRLRAERHRRGRGRRLQLARRRGHDSRRHAGRRLPARGDRRGRQAGAHGQPRRLRGNHRRLSGRAGRGLQRIAASAAGLGQAVLSRRAGALSIAILAMLAGGVTTIIAGAAAGIATFCVTAAVLAVIAVAQNLAARRAAAARDAQAP